MDETTLRLSIVGGLHEIDRGAWDAVANPPGERYDPFLSWDFLETLEASGAVSPREGWTPMHLTANHPDGRLRAAMPLYAKAHSYGEFVFDHSWADAYERAGGRYYPKLLAAVPFTPVSGRRRLVPPGPRPGHAPARTRGRR
ncbi:MAG: peptidogalycan biosysnthesis protein, partial [Pseudomonadota bacterium]